MKRFNLILLTLSLLASSAAISAALKSDKTQTEQAKQTIKTAKQGYVEVIQSAIIKLNQLTVSNAYSPQMASVLVNEEISPLFDFNYIANEVLSVINANLTKGEIQFFADKLKKNIVAILLAKLSQANSTSFSFISARPIMGNAIVVRLRVNGYSSFSFYVDLLFHQNKNKKWQIFDIVLNNDSLINYYQKMLLIQARRYGIYGI